MDLITLISRLTPVGRGRRPTSLIPAKNHGIKYFLVFLTLTMPSVDALGADLIDPGICYVNDRVKTQLNVRNGASQNDRIIGSLRHNQRIPCEKHVTNDNWIKINYDGHNGFVHKRYVYLTPDAKSVENSTTRQSITPEKTNSSSLAADSIVVILVLLVPLLALVVFSIRSKKGMGTGRENGTVVSDSGYGKDPGEPPGTITSMFNRPKVQLQEGEETNNSKRVYAWGFVFTATLIFCLLVFFRVIRTSEELFSFAFLGIPVAYIALLLESFKSNAWSYLRNLNHVEDVVSYIDRLQGYDPKIEWHCVCYHFETRRRMVTEFYTEYETQYDYNTGQNQQVAVQKTREKEETYEERVNTWNGTKSFSYDHCQDISPRLTDDIKMYDATKVALSKTFRIANDSLMQRYSMEKRDFEQRNAKRDQYHEFWEEVSIHDFKEHVLCIVDKDRVAIHLRWPIYLLSSLLGLSWFHRMWIEATTVNGSYKFVKQLT